MNSNFNYERNQNDLAATGFIGSRVEIPEIFYKRSELVCGERVGQILESFGYLGSDAPHRVNIPVSLSFSFKIGNINVIFGPSGAGKTSILNKIKELLGGGYLVDLPVENDDFLINLVGSDTKDAIRILAATGLGEGNLFLRKCSQLSEGQKFRMRLALEFSQSSNQIIHIDEFGSKLDPTTAKALAKSLAKNIRRSGKCFFICCNNLEVALAFNADTLIKLGYNYKVEVGYRENIHKEDYNQIEIVNGSLADYESFRRYHYLDTDGRIDNSKVLIAVVKNEKVGIAILVPPLSQKREVLHPYFQQINHKMVTGHRTVIHPEFRGTGIGRMLTVDGPRDFGYKIIEHRSTLYSFVPIPLYWGYQEYTNWYFENRPCYDELEKYIAECGFDPRKLIFREYCQTILSRLDRRKLAGLIKRDEDEKHQAQLFYYCSIMERCGFGYKGDINELSDLLVSCDQEPETDEEFINALTKHKQSYYRSFYCDLRK